MVEYQRNPDVIAALSEEQYWVTQENGTERPGTGALLNNKQPGLYVDIVSGEPLFTSGAKFDSGCGWPSFTKPVETQHVKELRDSSLGMVRVEVRSLQGDSHLGHVFPDGPQARGGLRYCINSASLRFIHLDDLEAGLDYFEQAADVWPDNYKASDLLIGHYWMNENWIRLDPLLRSWLVRNQEDSINEPQYFDRCKQMAH